MNGNNIFIVVLLQATYTIQKREFNFPSEVQALIGSCVEIPCTIKASETEPKNKNVVWHRTSVKPFSRIIYSTDPSEISEDYKNRASLIGNPEDSCTLRIHTVTRKDENGYYPAERKLPIQLNRRFPEKVQLRVTDIPPQPELLLPGEIIEGTPSLITCSVEHTCATSPPVLNWNFSGLPVKENNTDNGKGKWLATSQLTYLPFGENNGSSILCIATFPNGQTSQAAAKLNIIKVEHKSNITITAIIVVACLILLSFVALFIWRFLLGNKASRSCNVCKKIGSFMTKDTKDQRYTDLMEREITHYNSLKPTTQGEARLQQPANKNSYANIYEDIPAPVR